MTGFRFVLRLLTVLLACLAKPALANAPIYKYVDAYGNVTYSNIPVPGAKRSTLPPVQINPYTPPSALLQNRDGASRITVRPQANPDPRGSTPSSPGGYPVIDSATQRQRDSGRARILQEELNNEQKALSNARRMLKETEQHAKPDSALLRGLRDAVTEREKNIAALQREISRR